MQLCSVKPNDDVTTDPGGEVDLSLKIKLDTDHEGGVLEIAIVVDGALKQVSLGRSETLSL